MLSGDAEVPRPDGGPLVCAVVSGTRVSEPPVMAPQTAAPPQSDLASCFVTAEECLRLLPQRLKESFQVTLASARAHRPHPWPRSHLGRDC